MQNDKKFTFEIMDNMTGNDGSHVMEVWYEMSEMCEVCA